jgi:hypothetical protein
MGRCVHKRRIGGKGRWGRGRVGALYSRSGICVVKIQFAFVVAQIKTMLNTKRTCWCLAL